MIILSYLYINQMISTSRLLTRTIMRSLRSAPRFNMNHIKDLREQNIRVQAEEISNLPQVEESARVYKPSYTIQFNREGEVLLYSANTIKNQTIYFKYPYVLYQSFIPLAILNYVLNPLDMVWYITSMGLYGCLSFVIPRIWYFSDFKWYPQKLYLLRGGRVLKIESQTVGNDKYMYWLQNFMVRPLTQDKMRFDDRDEADFLTEEGQLDYDLNVEVEHLQLFGVNMNDQQLYFKKHGTVHHPELFEAALKGYNIDTTDFVINTADNVRYREGTHDQ